MAADWDGDVETRRGGLGALRLKYKGWFWQVDGKRERGFQRFRREVEQEKSDFFFWFMKNRWTREFSGDICEKPVWGLELELR